MPSMAKIEHPKKRPPQGSDTDHMGGKAMANLMAEKSLWCNTGKSCWESALATFPLTKVRGKVLH